MYEKLDYQNYKLPYGNVTIQKCLYHKASRKAISIPRNELLIPPIKNDEEVIPYVSTYDPNNTEMFSILKNNLHFLTSDQTMRDALSGTKIIKSKRQPPNLKKNLSPKPDSQIIVQAPQILYQNVIVPTADFVNV